MKNLKSFSHFALSQHQMKKISGGKEPATLLICTKASGGSQLFLLYGDVTNDKIATAVDSYNSNHSDDVVGCEVPSSAY